MALSYTVSRRNLFRVHVSTGWGPLQGPRNGVGRGRRGRKDGLVWVDVWLGHIRTGQSAWWQGPCCICGGWPRSGGKVTGSGWQGVATQVAAGVDGRCSYLFLWVQTSPVPCQRAVGRPVAPTGQLTSGAAAPPPPPNTVPAGVGGLG